jgi:hypothetical protein
MESDSQSMSMLKDELVKTFPGLEIEEHGDLEGFFVRSAFRNALGWRMPLYTVYTTAEGYSGYRAISDLRKGIEVDNELPLIIKRSLKEVMLMLELDFRKHGGIFPTFPTVEELITKILVRGHPRSPLRRIHQTCVCENRGRNPRRRSRRPGGPDREAIAATLLYRFKTGRWRGEKPESQPLHMGETDAYIDHVYCEVCGNCVTCNLRPCRDGGAHTPRRCS